MSWGRLESTEEKRVLFFFLSDQTLLRSWQRKRIKVTNIVENHGCGASSFIIFEGVNNENFLHKEQKFLLYGPS